jgi:hypothetical protein
MPSYYVGLDLGQRSDYSAIAVIERQAEPPQRPALALRYLHRWPLGTSYPTIVQQVGRLLQREPLAGNAVFLADATGVGRPTIDMLEQAGLSPYAITITGGSNVLTDGREIRVPKRDLAMAVQLLLQDRRLKFAAALPLLDVLRAELQSFEVKINPATAHDSYLAWREGAHDDLVLASAMSAWYAESHPPIIVPRTPRVASRWSELGESSGFGQKGGNRWDV